jgi:hypothetical protein
MRMQKPWTVQLEDLWVIKGIHLFKVKKLSFLMKNVQKKTSRNIVFFLVKMNAYALFCTENMTIKNG